MSNKTKAVVIIFDLTNSSSDIDSASLNQLITDGNTQLLAFRKRSITNEVEVFNAFTSISQLEGRFIEDQGKDTALELSSIEENFFKISNDCKFTDLFHNGGIPKAKVITENKEILK